MKNRLLLLPFVLFVFVACSDKSPTTPESIPEGTPVYHIQGFKDKRLDAAYMATFVSLNTTSDKCSQVNPTTARKKPTVMTKTYLAGDDNYTIDIPIVLSDNTDGCGYNFTGLELRMRRVGDPSMYSSFMLLWNRPRNNLTTYYGYHGGSSGGPDPEMPHTYVTDRAYFRIAPDTSFLCRTEYKERKEYTEEQKNGFGFHCVMKINSGDTEFHAADEFKFPAVTNPQFGVDNITSSNLTINFIADDNGSLIYSDQVNNKGIRPDRFREYIPPKKGIF